MPDNFGLKIGIEGEKEFKNALKDINQSFKVLGSEMQLVTSQFDKNDNSIQGLTARNEVLNKSIDTQKDKISTLQKALDNASKLVDDNSCNIIDQNDYISKYDSYVKRYETAKAKLEKLQSQRQQRLAKHDSIGAFMFELSEQDEVLNEFDERLFGIVVERIMVRESGLEFEFNC